MKKQNACNESVKDEEKDVNATKEGQQTTDSGDRVADETSAEADTMADKKTTEEHLQDELAQLKDSHLRLQAEFDNYRKRTLKEKMDLIQSGGREVLLAMLPVMDDIQRAVMDVFLDSLILFCWSICLSLC